MPDVVTTENHEGFNGFEDVSSESGKVGKKDTAQDSGSDVELPDQIVNDAIKRIHVDSEELENSDSEKGSFQKYFLLNSYGLFNLGPKITLNM